MPRQTEGRTEGQKDGRKDRPYFIGPSRLLLGVQKKIELHPCKVSIAVREQTQVWQVITVVYNGSF